MNKMIIPAVVIMAAAPVMMQAADFAIPANATCVQEGEPVTLNGTFTFNNLDYIEIHYTTSNNRVNPRFIEVTVGETRYSVEATFDGSEYVAKFLVKADNLTVPDISVSITGAGSIDVKSASATTGVYQGLVTQYNGLKEKLTALQAYPETKKVEKVYEAAGIKADIKQLADDLAAIKTTLDSKYTAGTDENVATWFAGELTTLNYTNRDNSIRTAINNKAKAIDDANKEVADAITAAETALNDANTYLRSYYTLYTADLARALQEIQKQRSVLTQINTDNGTSLTNQTSDVDKDGLIARVNAVTAEIGTIKNTIEAAKTAKDNAYTTLKNQINAVATQATDCPNGFAFKSTSFQTDKDAIVKKVDDARYTDDILSLDITTRIDNYNAKVALYNAAVTKAKAIKTAYDAAVTTINGVPTQITTAKSTINGLKTTDCKYTDNDNGLSYTQNLNLNGKGAELTKYEDAWKLNGTVINDLNQKWTDVKKLAYTDLGADGYKSSVETAAESIASQKTTDLAAVDAIVADAQTLITAYNAVFGNINGVASTWTAAVNDAKNSKMYEKTGYTGFTGASYATLLGDQKTRLEALVQEVATAASTPKTIAEKLAAVQAAIQSNKWIGIANAISTLTATKDARETAFKTDALKAAQEDAKAAWANYVNARTNSKFVAPTEVHSSVLTGLKNTYDALVAQYEVYEDYKNATVNANDYDNQLAHFELVKENESAFANEVTKYISDLEKAQQAFAQNNTLYGVATDAVNAAKTALAGTADNHAPYNNYSWLPGGTFWGGSTTSVEYLTAEKYKAGRVATISDALATLLTEIDAAKTACTLYDNWGHDNVKGTLQTRLDDLNTRIGKVDTDIWKAIELQGKTPKSSDYTVLKNGKAQEVLNDCLEYEGYCSAALATLTNGLNAQIESASTDSWVVGYETEFNLNKAKYYECKSTFELNLNNGQTQYDARTQLANLVTTAQTKLDDAWNSPDLDAIEHFVNELIAVQKELNDCQNVVGNSWSSDKSYTGYLDLYKETLQEYAGTASVKSSIDAIVAASKANLEAKTALDKKDAELKEQLDKTINNLIANKIEVTENGVTTTKTYTFETEEELAKKNAALDALNAFKNTDGEIFGANVAFSGKSVTEEIKARYKEGQAATNQAEVKDGIDAFSAAITNVMVNLESGYAGIVTDANQAVKTAFDNAYEEHKAAYNDAIAELQKYQKLSAGDFRDKVMETLTNAVTDITAQKTLADAKNTSFTADDQSLYDTDGYYDKSETAKAYVEARTTEIGTILTNFTTAVNALAVTAFNAEIATATAAYATAKGQVTSENGWTITTANFADVKNFIDSKNTPSSITALNYATKVAELTDAKTGYAALIAADKVKYAEAQLAAYKKIGKDKAAAAKTTVNGYKHLTDAHKSALISGIDGVLSAYETNLTKGVSDLWSSMAIVKSNSTGSYQYSNTALSISSPTTIDGFLSAITGKALDMDTDDWKNKVQVDLSKKLAAVTGIYNTLNNHTKYTVLSASESEYAQTKNNLQSELDGLYSWIEGKKTEIAALDTRGELEDETTHGTIGGVITDKYNSLTGTNDIVTRFDAAEADYKTWKANQELAAYRTSADVQAAVKLAESWIPQNYQVSETADYTAIVKRVNDVKAAIAAAMTAEDVDYLAFGKGTGTGDNIPALLVVIDKHNSENHLIADMAAETKAAIDGFKKALVAENNKQADYVEGAKSDFSEVDTKLAEVNAAYTAALGNGTLVFADVQQKMKDAVSVLTSTLSDLATTAANKNKIIIKTNANEAGWAKVQAEYAEFEKVYDAAFDKLAGYADVKDNVYSDNKTYTEKLEAYMTTVKNDYDATENTYKAFKDASDQLTANGLSENASIANLIATVQDGITQMLSHAEAAQHAYDVQQAYNRLTEAYAPVVEYWNTAKNTLTSYDYTVQESFADEKQAVVNEMSEVENSISNITDANYLANEQSLTEQINGLKGKIDALLQLAAENNKGAAGTGDVVGDGVVDLDDYDAILNHILGKELTEDQKKAADVNNDGRVNVADLQGVLNIYHYGAWNRTEPQTQSNSRRRMAAYLNAAADNLEAEVNGAQGVAEIALNLDNRQAYTSFQFDVKLPEGMQFDLVSLTERAEGLDVQTGLLADGTIRVVATATEATIEAGTGAVARLSIATEGITDGEIVIDNIVFADQFANAKTFAGFALTADAVTGISGNASLAHRAVRSIYNAGGQLMDKVQHGFNILVGEDGAAKKVLKK